MSTEFISEAGVAVVELLIDLCHGHTLKSAAAIVSGILAVIAFAACGILYLAGNPLNSGTSLILLGTGACLSILSAVFVLVREK